MLPHYDSSLYYHVLPCGDDLAVGQGRVLTANEAGFVFPMNAESEADALQTAAEQIAHPQGRTVYLVLNQDGTPRLYLCAPEDLVEILPASVTRAPRRRPSALAA